MNTTNNRKILDKARNYLKMGLFNEGYIYLKEKKNYFFLLTRSKFIKEEYFFLLGAILVNLGEYKKSILYLRKSLLNPNLDKSETLYYLIKAFLNLDDKNKIKYYLNHLLDRSFSPFYIILSYYECHKKNIDINISNEFLNDFIPSSNKNLYDILSNSLYLLLIKNQEEAYKLIKVYKKIYNRIFFYNLIYLKILFHLSKYQEILEYFNENTSYLGNIELLFIYASAFNRLNLLDFSIKLLEELLFLEKHTNRNLINLGVIYFKKKEYSKAIEYFKLALKKTKEQKNKILFFLSISYQKIGLLNDSIKNTIKIDRESIYYQKAIYNASLLYYSLGEYNKAKELFNEINIKNIPLDRYNKWKKIIFNEQLYKTNFKLLKLIIYFIPWLLILFSIIIMLFFIYVLKK